MTQNLLRHAWPLLRGSRYGPGQKFMGLMHLASYAVQPLIMLVFLLTPPLIAGDMFAQMPNLGLLGGLGLIPVLIMVAGQVEQRRDWRRTLRYLPLQGAVGMALVLNNTLGVVEALIAPRRARVFKRTPKFAQDGAQSWRGSRYALPADLTTLGEIGLGLYAVGGAVLALDRLPALIPYLLGYAVSFIGLALATLWQGRDSFSRPKSYRKARRAWEGRTP